MRNNIRFINPRNYIEIRAVTWLPCSSLIVRVCNLLSHVFLYSDCCWVGGVSWGRRTMIDWSGKGMLAFRWVSWVRGMTKARFKVHEDGHLPVIPGIILRKLIKMAHPA